MWPRPSGDIRRIDILWLQTGLQVEASEGCWYSLQTKPCEFFLARNEAPFLLATYGKLLISEEYNYVNDFGNLFETNIIYNRAIRRTF